MRASRVNPTCVDPGATRRDVSTVHRLCRETPGSRVFAPASPSLVRDTRVGGARSRGARSEPLAVVVFTMSNSAVFFVPAARCCARVRRLPRIRLSRPPASPRGSGRRPSRQQQFRPPDEGWMERRQPHSQLRSRLRRATPHPGATGNNSRRSTVAVFGCGPTKPAPGSGTGACSDVPRQAL